MGIWIGLNQQLLMKYLKILNAGCPQYISTAFCPSGIQSAGPNTLQVLIVSSRQWRATFFLHWCGKAASVPQGAASDILLSIIWILSSLGNHFSTITNVSSIFRIIIIRFVIISHYMIPNYRLVPINGCFFIRKDIMRDLTVVRFWPLSIFIIFGQTWWITSSRLLWLKIFHYI